ncbi:hypothetical protein B296_00022201 [Ensete ventricosum]|uniref:Uncharacterized protein n=1 Tax=Ensete ventricosum TaxID=4639 RepID=A0A427AYW5_ENSVE|nr:hypothetical protein B296_00022201 [Ensete ventricosum]
MRRSARQFKIEFPRRGFRSLRSSPDYADDFPEVQKLCLIPRERLRHAKDKAQIFTSSSFCNHLSLPFTPGRLSVSRVSISMVFRTRTMRLSARRFFYVLPDPRGSSGSLSYCLVSAFVGFLASSWHRNLRIFSGVTNPANSC